MDLLELVNQRLSHLDAKRKEVKENSGYMVQYLPCGCVRELAPDEINLVNRAKNNPYLDALVLHSTQCPNHCIF